MIISTISTIIASGIISKVCTGLFAGSTLLTAAKNNGAKHKVERQGFKVNSDKRSITERTISFIKDYFFLIVPGYNLYKSFKTFLKNDEEYADERKALYAKRERLVKIEEKPKTVEKPIKEKEEVKEERPVKKENKKEEINKEDYREVFEIANLLNQPKPKKTEKPEEPKENINPFAGLTEEQLIDLKKHYKRIWDLLQSKYARKVAEKAPVAELNEIALKAIEIKKLYGIVVERLESIEKTSSRIQMTRSLK